MIFVQSEFARLQKVVLAESEFGYPLEVRASDLRFLADGAEEDSIANRGRSFAEAYPDLQLQWETERKVFRQTLEKHGVEVLTVRKLTIAEKEMSPKDGYSNFFTRDPFFVIGNTVVEGAMRFLHRRHEVWPLRDLFLREVYPADCMYVAAPYPEIADERDLTLGNGPFIEGGDVLVLDKHVFVGNSGLASNELGFRWLSKLLTPLGYTVQSVRLHPEILHLDCALGLVRKGLMVLCEEALLDGVPVVLKDWKSISVTLDEAKNLATNGLPVSEEVYITDPAFRHIGEQIEQEGIQVEYVDFRISRSFGGAFRCSTQPLLRA